MNTGWTLAIKNQAWTEDTENQIDFLIRTMSLTGKERILDLACGFGRHSLALARRGYSVVGVDFTKEYIEDAKKNASGLNVEFICSDVRNVRFHKEFDVVLNLADGAIGYFETEEENNKLFDVIAHALKPGGKHFMDACNAEHAKQCFPKRHWLAGEKELSLAEFFWDAKTRRMSLTGHQLPYGEPLLRPEPHKGPTTRLYTASELCTIFNKRQMTVQKMFSDYYGAELSAKHLQLLVYSQKEK